MRRNKRAIRIRTLERGFGVLDEREEVVKLFERESERRGWGFVLFGSVLQVGGDIWDVGIGG